MRHGGPVGVLIMGVTVGGLLFLIILQGSFFWPSSSSSSYAAGRDGGIGSSNNKVDLHHHLKGKEQWDSNRLRFLEAIQKTPSGDGASSSSLCTHLPSRTTTARKLWVQYIGAILAASQHPDDPDFLHEEWTKRLLSELPPLLLQETLQSSSSSSSQQTLPNMARILDIIQQKLVNPTTAPPLRIAVVGGTFAEGEGCSLASVSVPEGSSMANPTFCAWPYRLQAFLNKFMGSNSNSNNNNHVEWVQIINLSEEGTDTGFMIPLVRNWIYPKALLPHGPDIIINAYGRYDYETYGEASPTNLKETIQSELSTFVRAVKSSHPCGTTPMIIHMADTVEQQLSPLDDVFSIHYQKAFDRAMQADRQKDFAMAGHMAMTWVLAFGALEAALRHCQTTTTSSKDVVASAVVPEENCKDPSTGDPSCPFAFFASPQGTVTRVTEFQKYLKPYTTSNNGWEVLSDMGTGWSRKTGLVAISAGAQMVLQIKNITKEVRYFHLMTLKSNVEPWRTGKVRFRVAILVPGKENQAPLETSFEIDGSHVTKSQDPEHITHHYNMDFDTHKAPIGSDIMISLELVEGTNFKVLGLMLCS